MVLAIWREPDDLSNRTSQWWTLSLCLIPQKNEGTLGQLFFQTRCCNSIPPDRHHVVFVLLYLDPLNCPLAVFLNQHQGDINAGYSPKKGAFLKAESDL